MSVEETNHDYLGNIVTGWLHEGDFGEPDSLLLITDNSEYGFDLALIYQEGGLVQSLRRNYHPYTGTENATDKASLLQHALEIIKLPFDYDFYDIQVPQTINELVIYGDSISDPHFRRILDATLDSHLIREALILEANEATLPLPATFFRSEPVIIVLGLYLVLLYILLFTFLSGFDYIFKETYKLKPGYQSSCFAAIAAGATAFAVCGPGLYEWARQHTERIRGALIQPEFRLWPAIVTAPSLPMALFWLGWTNYSTISIWNGLGACFLFGIVLASIYVSSYEYITDSYGEHSAIALGSITMSRYLIAGGMDMAARPMYEGIGVHWTMTVLGCIAMLLMPTPLLFWKYGPELRRRSPYATTNV
ncbi:hypothetical protein FVEG_15242 [Fusarium verticillioides 7600]|uniref:Major facilitator superfamily (MFS) profile domain-containing protein n=1 Tax=Gibberella moniliformis (strain M3125 / FGSC 7600) TaxID=334819 RepID=W7M8C7_GIBM7|nr:hypothetical protein FVEG_15242 [Fusarium verticillioides 7600]EWG41167.1 hypothetical protein FVEG_15242 [Fusarium verticillioides 7600]